MEEYAVLYSYFEKIINRELTEAEEEEISSVFRKETFNKKQRIFNAGEKNTRHYYIETGLLRMYIIDQSGKEFNVLFGKERQWLGDLGTPASTSYFLETVEKTTAFSISEDAFSILMNKYPDLGTNIRRSYIFLQKRFVAILSKTAEENYEELLTNDPDLVQRLPQYHISSYLGVTPVFLSKIIAKRVKKRD
ncbi:Crp/Fnr family transcriptional regulator [Draconibacterium sp. IB214405]|uniref:Crp/Fnr family transcriptional regulator n=1 Tax=Draconibacterium sp. IB214405 TaxID=3097352 RepID=UPI002A0C7C82|nr:Crp/Fnr family transcriptional regulator [Draconibacterium sp. IB214405]MDX8341115.1 Crp/Fnr family transcriptional regulator [Draconibacterium sp. IB214405]